MHYFLLVRYYNHGGNTTRKSAYRKEAVLRSETQESTDEHTAHPTLPPANNGWFGKTSSATGIDQESHVAKDRATAHFIIEAGGLHLHHLSLHVGREEDHLNRASVVPEVRRLKRRHLIRREVLAQFLVHDQQAGRGRADRVRQRLPRQVIVDESGHGANAPQSEGHENERRGVHEIDRDNLLGFDPVHILKPCAIFQRRNVRLVESPSATVVDDERPVLGVGGERMFLEDIEEVQDIAVGGHARREGRFNQATNQFHIVK